MAELLRAPRAASRTWRRRGRGALAVSVVLVLTLSGASGAGGSSALSGAPPSSLGSGTRVELGSADGFPLATTRFVGGREKGVLLVPQCDGEQSMWFGVAEALRDRGVTVLTLDPRGLGASAHQSLDRQSLGSREFWRRVEESFAADLDAALAELQELLDPGAPIALGGASCGGREAARLARRLLTAEAPTPVVALLMFSVRLGDRLPGELSVLGDLSSLWIAAEGDRGAAATSRAAESALAGARARIFAGSAHGAPLLDQEGSLQGQMVAFLLDALGVGRGRP